VQYERGSCHLKFLWRLLDSDFNGYFSHTFTANSDVEPTIRCNATIALAKCASHLPEAVRDKVIASSLQKVMRLCRRVGAK
jgi:hypothetical protein